MKKSVEPERVWIAFQGFAYAQVDGVGMLRLSPERVSGLVIEIEMDLLTPSGWKLIWRDSVPDEKRPIPEHLDWDELPPMTKLESVKFNQELVKRAVNQAAFLYGDKLRRPSIVPASEQDFACLSEARRPTW